MKLEALKDIKQHIVSATGTESQMTLKYLKDVSTLLAVVSAIRFSAERDNVKLIFAFDHINSARRNTYQHVYLNNLL